MKIKHFLIIASIITSYNINTFWNLSLLRVWKNSAFNLFSYIILKRESTLEELIEQDIKKMSQKNTRNQQQNSQLSPYKAQHELCYQEYSYTLTTQCTRYKQQGLLKTDYEIFKQAQQDAQNASLLLLNDIKQAQIQINREAEEQKLMHEEETLTQNYNRDLALITAGYILAFKQKSAQTSVDIQTNFTMLPTQRIAGFFIGHETEHKYIPTTAQSPGYSLIQNRHANNNHAAPLTYFQQSQYQKVGGKESSRIAWLNGIASKKS